MTDIMIRYIKAFPVLLCLCALPLHAQHRDAGRTLFGFMNINYDARTVALAGACVALPNDCYSIFSNPGALGYVNTMQAVIGYRPVGTGVYGSPLACALPYKGIGVFGAGVYGLTSGNVAVTDIGPDGGVLFTDGFSRVDNIAGNAVWARKINDFLSVGASVKGFYSSIKGFEDRSPVRWSSDGFACEIGAQCRFMNSRLIYGFVARNLGFIRSGYEKNDSGYSLPFGVDIGISYVPRYIENLRVILDLSKINNDYLSFKPAAEWELLAKQLVVRGGYSFSWRDLRAFKNTLSGYSDASYFKSSMIGICLGAGFSTEIAGRKMHFDTAAEFLTIPVLPALVVSMLVNI